MSATLPGRRSVLIAALALAPVLAHADVAPYDGAQWVACPKLLMPNECREYQRRMNQAHSAQAREKLDQEYAKITEDRGHACRCGATGAGPGDPIVSITTMPALPPPGP